MANAAAKKAAAAKQDAAKVYMPLIVIVNIIYALLLLGTSDSIPYDGTKWGIFGMIVTWAMQAYAYIGILESSAIAAAKIKSNKDLAGGANLDLLAVTVFVQFSSVLHSTRWFAVTIFGVPIIAGYKLYRTIYGCGGGGGGGAGTKSQKLSKSENSSDDPAAAKRQRRAEKRRQKWG
ncbi:unnamed protein product [Pseudo-nitzschia multistriata]|uniref:Uncharacterized protein n=1 Tax=Pseudo-nitzschia multistriata TaxID=183589 RepID=A0A448Z9E1_9STRA|nr:unnamed protein product [Pseudo-nitzschia multistriata]